jgi:predicted phage tail protein
MAVGPSLIQVLTDASGATTSTTEDGTGSGTYSEGTWREDPGLTQAVYAKGGLGGIFDKIIDAHNALQSNATARFIDLISEGPCVGLADRTNPMKSVYINDVALQNSDGTYNFSGMQIYERLGNPSDDPVIGFSQAENERAVGIQCTTSISPVVAVTDTDVTSVRLKVMVPALFQLDEKDGSTDPTSVTFKFQVQPNGGSYADAFTDTISGKTTAQFEKAYRFTLPGTGPWNIKMVRITANSTDAKLQNDTYFEALTEVIDARLQYPNSAYLAVMASAKQFGSSIPNRSYDWKGRIIQVPTNYNPDTRAYATTGAGTTGGVWDGTFKDAWTDNPAWILYDILTNNRYGLGDDIPASYQNKWALYEIGQYCDGLVPAPGGGTEPRYTINTQIVDRGEAWDLVMSITSVFRGMFYWGAGQLEFTYDHDQTATKLVTKANVVDGKINYSSDTYRSRHSVAIISWNDPELGHRTNYEVVEDNTLITKYGYKQIETTAWGCVSRGQAHRVGRWLLDTEKYGELVQYTASIDHADVRPGSVIEINDPEYTSYRNAGRLATGSTTTVLQLDAPMTKVGAGGTVKVVLSDGSVVTKTVTTGAGVTSTLTLSSALPSVPLDGAMWSFAESGVTPRLWRVLGVEETSPMEFTVTAMWHDPNKYARVEYNIDLAPNSYTNLQTGPLLPPTNLALIDTMINNGDSASPGMIASWTAPNDARVMSFDYQVKKFVDTDWGIIGNTPMCSAELRDKIGATGYDLRVRSVGINGMLSKWELLSDELLEGGRGAIAAVTGLAVVFDATADATVIKWDDKPSTEYRALNWEILYNSSSSTFASAVSLGTTTMLQWPVSALGYYWVRGTYAGVLGTATMVQATAASFPDSTAIETFLTNESHTVATAADGSGGSYTSAGGTFKVFDGLTDVTTSGAFSVVSTTGGLSISIGAATGIYTITALSSDTGSAVLQVIYNGVTIQRTYSIAKSKAGTNGSSAKLLYIYSDRQLISYDNTGSPNPSTQTTNFTIAPQALSTGTYTISMTRADGTVINANTYLTVGTGSFSASGNNITWSGSGTTFSMTAANFNTAKSTTNGVIVSISHADGVGDKISVVRTLSGSDGVNGVTITVNPGNLVVACDSAGTAKAGEFNKTSQITVMNGQTNVTTSATYGTATFTGCTGSVNSSTGVVTFTAISADTATCSLTVTYGSASQTITITLKKVKDGANGSGGGGSGTYGLTAVSGNTNSTNIVVTSGTLYFNDGAINLTVNSGTGGSVTLKLYNTAGTLVATIATYSTIAGTGTYSDTFTNSVSTGLGSGVWATWRLEVSCSAFGGGGSAQGSISGGYHQ